MDPINTRRWPRYQVYLPVVIAAKIGGANLAVPGLVCELSRSGLEVYGGVNLQPGDPMEVEFRTQDRIRIAGVVRNRTGFCFGLEFRPAWRKAGTAPEALETLIRQRHEAYLREARENIRQTREMVLEIRKCRNKIELLSFAVEDWLAKS
ncbi:MAG: PilZ domain-containing protein [Candidatus Sulfotelmatobacter sp.]|jgi:hypothetical protein